MIYLDTSALIKLYLREDGSEQVQAVLTAQDHPLPVWDLLEAEFRNAFRLKVFWGELAGERAERQIGLFERRKRSGQYVVPEIDRSRLMDVFETLSRETQRLGCRTMDILHVACASLLGAEAFVSFDSRQRALAAHAGLRLLPESLPNTQ